MKYIFLITNFLICTSALQAQDTCQGWQKAGSMGRQAQISINICERASGGSGYVTLKNSADTAVQVSYKINFNNGESQSGSTPIKANSETSGSSCFNCAEKNGGGIQSWSVYNIEFEGEVTSSSGNSSNKNKQSSSTSGWEEEEGLMNDDESNEDNSYSNDSYSEESINQKRQREARRAEERRLAQRRAEEKRVKDAIARQNRANAQMEQKAQQDLDSWNNMWDKAGDAVRADQERKWAEMERAREREAEAYKRREAERRQQQQEWERERLREKRERERKKAIEDAKKTFLKSLEDHKIPLFYEHPQAFVLCVSKINNETIKIIPALLYKNSDKQLPYKQDVINSIQKERNVENVQVHGIYSNFEDLKQASKRLYSKGKQRYITVTEANRIEFGKPQNNKTTKTNDSEDFWGNKKKKTKTKKDDDFWDN